jgi:hypothetical protein
LTFGNPWTLIFSFSFLQTKKKGAEKKEEEKKEEEKKEEEKNEDRGESENSEQSCKDGAEIKEDKKEEVEETVITLRPLTMEDLKQAKNQVRHKPLFKYNMFIMQLISLPKKGISFIT